MSEQTAGTSDAAETGAAQAAPAARASGILPISVLDLTPVDSGVPQSQALHNTIALAKVADRLGYTRYWLAEHHNSTGIVSTAPEVLIGHVASATQHLRVGSGGVMLPNHVPLKVAEIFRVLEALHPGRIDLGLGRAPGTDQRTALALRRSTRALHADDYPALVAELMTYNTGTFPADHPFRDIVAAPTDVELPPIWLLGSSDSSAQLAAAWGLRFSFAHHISAQTAGPAMRMYRDQFMPSAVLDAPHSMLALSVICADTDEEADRQAITMDLRMLRMRRGESGPGPTLEEALAYAFTEAEYAFVQDMRRNRCIGSPSTVRAKIEALVAETQADEVMIMPSMSGHATRVHCLELVAEAFGLATPAPAPADAEAAVIA